MEMDHTKKVVYKDLDTDETITDYITQKGYQQLKAFAENGDEIEIIESDWEQKNETNSAQEIEDVLSKIAESTTCRRQDFNSDDEFINEVKSRVTKAEDLLTQLKTYLKD